MTRFVTVAFAAVLLVTGGCSIRFADWAGNRWHAAGAAAKHALYEVSFYLGIGPGLPRFFRSARHHLTDGGSLPDVKPRHKTANIPHAV
ncbi:MAG TPA: hypothetical protein VK789_13840 [Bryobacteraceae bacterium]|jgi:hypothetical protein|nr:hypothetical protein [Bryobacteraceae bacterium]